MKDNFWSEESLQELATQWFSRAGPHAKLSLHFADITDASSLGRDFSGIIPRRPERFRELKILIREPASLSTFMRGHENHSYAFTQLEDLTIHCHQYRVGNDVSFAAAERLRRMDALIEFHSWEERKNFALGTS